MNGDTVRAVIEFKEPIAPSVQSWPTEYLALRFAQKMLAMFPGSKARLEDWCSTHRCFEPRGERCE